MLSRRWRSARHARTHDATSMDNERLRHLAQFLGAARMVLRFLIFLFWQLLGRHRLVAGFCLGCCAGRRCGRLRGLCWTCGVAGA